MPIYEEENKDKDLFDQATEALKGNVEQEEQYRNRLLKKRRLSKTKLKS